MGNREAQPVWRGQVCKICGERHDESTVPDEAFRKRHGYKVIAEGPEVATMSADQIIRLLKGTRRRLKPVRNPSHSQNRFDAEDLVILWKPMSRSLIYKVIGQKVKEGKIKLVGIERPKIDTTKTSKRAYTRFWISRKDKEKLEKELGLS